MLPFKKFLFPVMFFMAGAACTNNDASVATKDGNESMRTPQVATIKIGAYDFVKPDWYDTVEVTVPKNLVTEEGVRDYIRHSFGADVGTEQTWKSALKAWAIYYQQANNDSVPAYLGHCFMEGAQYKEAATVFTGLYSLLNNKEKNLFVGCHLAYNAGKAYEELKDVDKALTWYKQASEASGKDADGNTQYYVEESKKKLEVLSK